MAKADRVRFRRLVIELVLATGKQPALIFFTARHSQHLSDPVHTFRQLAADMKQVMQCMTCKAVQRLLQQPGHALLPCCSCSTLAL
jgi:hypothetical protein